MQTKSYKEFTNLLTASKRLIYHVIDSHKVPHMYRDDVFQEVSIKAWKGFDNFKSNSAFSTWISSITRYTAIDRIRRIKEQSDRLKHYAIFHEAIDSYIYVEYTENPLPPIDALSNTEKRTLEMRMNGLSFSDISHLTGEPRNRLITRMHRVKQKLKKFSEN